MLTTNYYRNIVWHNFQDIITEGNFLELVKKYNIDDYISRRFLGDINRDKALVINGHLFFSLSIPDLKDEEFNKQVLKFIIGKDYIISFSSTKNEGIEKFKADFEKNAHLGKGRDYENPIVYSFLHIFEKIYENMLFELKDVSSEIENIEKKIFSNKEKEMVVRISKVNRKLIDFRRYLKTHDDSWKIFLDLSKTFFPQKNSYTTLEGIVLSYQKALSQAEQLQENLWELRDTNNSLLNAKLGESSKTFTLIAFLTLPITLFISIISIPTKQGHLFLGHNNDFNLIIVTSITMLIVMAGISKIKKWW
ncbi:MAG: magnesium transporter CorA family protein [Candidatus Pacebacteria bacterium]|nr:magnesium transporter CorA family protein [Candidatus Paceibacterota bacterium]